MAAEASGKRVIFLYPPNMIEDISAELARNEFEIVTSKDHERLASWLKGRDDCLVYVNIEQGMKAADWLAWLAQRKADSPGAQFGVLGMSEDPALGRRLMSEIGLAGGYIVIKWGAQKAAEMMVKVLEAAEARGRRKYVRSAPGATGEFNVSVNGELARGKILDVSSVGMAFAFDGTQRLNQGVVLDDVGLNLRGARITLKVVVMGRREAEGEQSVHVGIFAPSSMDDVKRQKIRSFVQKSIQEIFDRELGY